MDVPQLATIHPPKESWSLAVWGDYDCYKRSCTLFLFFFCMKISIHFPGINAQEGVPDWRGGRLTKSLGTVVFFLSACPSHSHQQW